MLLRVISDLHCEHWQTKNTEKIKRMLLNKLPADPRDSKSYLVLAGDTGDLSVLDVYRVVLEELSKRFKGIFWCPGNHEWYCGDFTKDQKTYNELLLSFPNVFFRYNQIVEDVPVFCGTLWTDFNNMNPQDMLQAQIGMPDYKWIQNNGKPLVPEDIYRDHKITRLLLEDFLDKFGKSSVVITHHAPSFKSTAKRFEGTPLNSAFCSNLEDLILKYEPKVWIHGHLHNTSDYTVGSTRIICNPHGYHTYEDTKYNPKLFLEVS